jgi:hypothetical protein
MTEVEAIQRILKQTTAVFIFEQPHLSTLTLSNHQGNLDVNGASIEMKKTEDQLIPATRYLCVHMYQKLDESMIRTWLFVLFGTDRVSSANLEVQLLWQLSTDLIQGASGNGPCSDSKHFELALATSSIPNSSPRQ